MAGEGRAGIQKLDRVGTDISFLRDLEIWEEIFEIYFLLVPEFIYSL